jgi:anaerobic magnesium-protoporphyrin IX monomethyl ester cyclase
VARALLLQMPLFGLQRGRFCIPQGPLSIATFLNRQGHECRVVPLDFTVMEDQGVPVGAPRPQILEATRRAVTRLMEEFQPRLVGATVFSAEYPMALEVMAHVKSLDPEVLTLVGGPHVSFYDRECLAEAPQVDLVVRHEGEWTAAELLAALDRDGDFSAVAGITRREGDGRVVRNPDRPFGDLDELPIPDYRLLPHDFVNRSWIPFVFTRGCPFNCHFCAESALWGHKVRGRRVSDVIAELRYIATHYQDQVVAFQDSLFNSSRKYCDEICSALRDLDLGLETYVHLRADNVYPELFAALRDSGKIRAVSFGVESASPRVLKVMNKKATWEQSLRACRMARDHGLGVHTLWIVGHPGDSPAEFEISYRAMRTLWQEGLHEGLDLSIFYPYPGTLIYENREKLGLRMLTDNWEDYASADVPVCELEGFSAAQITESLERARRLRDEYLLLERITRKKREPRPAEKAGPAGG